MKIGVLYESSARDTATEVAHVLKQAGYSPTRVQFSRLDDNNLKKIARTFENETFDRFVVVLAPRRDRLIPLEQLFREYRTAGHTEFLTLVFRNNSPVLSDVAFPPFSWMVFWNEGDDPEERLLEAMASRPRIVDDAVSPISIYLDPGDASAELLTDFFVALSVYYQSLGGSGVRIVKDEQRSLQGELA